MTSGPLDGQFPMMDGPGGLGPPPPPGPQSGTFPRGSKKNQCKFIYTFHINLDQVGIKNTVIAK
jgi:hypothetical protein